MVLPILTYPDARLGTVCAPAVLDDALRDLAAAMLETMYAAPGRGLAAPQVGAMLRLFVMDVTWKEGARAPVVMVNPEVLWRSDEQAEGPEGCLSIPGPTTMITRAQSVRMRWVDLDGAVQEETLTGMAAICAQHEYDHLDGVLTLDHLDEAARALALSELELPKNNVEIS
ncbi:peptide deformylase [Xinfangfangia sp. CPCC 101601]|uniref:Peptide deformylase n=1 Tax=Pseudogemmobacter lacusdianii TaxID=3069608 RepID=A0ABU0VXF5_9RHOB|nr:peptide deformylase [Xinfangfangia sp. CPCC 101601]MDQ2066439.1 peptide deformylase [Xinfangfangia sp. CPCC 101601]